MLLRAGFVAAIAFSLSGCIINVNGADMGPMEHEYKELTLGTSQLTELTAITGAGELNIVGVKGLTQVKVQADIYHYQGQSAELTLVKDGKSALLKAGFDSSISFNRSPYIDLTIQVPARFALNIDDGSGPIDIRQVNANITLDDGSGSINIEGGKNLAITDGSGSISLAKIDGNINLDDGSGAIDITQVKGNVAVEDGSGSLSISNVSGVVTIDDGSGDINVEDTQGLTIVDAGSGDVHFDNINGPVSMH